MALRFLFLSSLLFLAACGDSAVKNTSPVPAPPATPDEFVDRFEQAWEELDYGAYEALLHEDFVFHFAQEDVDNSSVPGSSWPRLEELLSASRMFSGSGSSRNVTGVTLALSPVTAWSDLVAPEFAGTTKRSYFANLTVNYSNGDIADARGQQVLYLAPVEVEHDGATVASWQLKFWRDLGFSEAPRQGSTESSSWGQVKALYSN